MRSRGLIIAIDGPSGAGKTTAGRALAERLGYLFVDTGAMYRALALKALRRGTGLDSEPALGGLVGQTRIELVDGGRRVLLDGEDVTAAIRAPQVSEGASRISIHPLVRRDMVRRQREMAGQGGAVLDGRDIGTVVFPGADLKFFLDADPRCRALRRSREQQASGESINLDAIEREIRERDHRDATRADSPLLAARDALRLDTTDLSPDRVLDRMLAAVEARRRATPVEVGGPGVVTRPEPPSSHRVCPWWLGYWLVSPLRRLLEDPDRILGPHLTPGMTVLDVGCGMGFFSLPMARLLGPSGRVHCVDLQARMLRGLERRARKAGLSERIMFHRCEDRSLGLDGLKGSIGFALAHSVVHEVPSPSHLMAELADLLTATGRLLLAEPRLHISGSDFESELAVAAEAGLGVSERPHLRGSRAAILCRLARPQ